MSKIRVGVLRGGPSTEHDVSLKTGENVLNFLPEQYQGVDVFINKDNQWHANGYQIEPCNLYSAADVVFNGLHGYFGEDGKVQNIFESLNIPYTGSGVLSSAMAMNKVLSKEIFKKYGLKIPGGLVISNNEQPEEAAQKVFRNIHPFWIIKPVSGGSSIGVNIARNFGELVSAIENVFNFYQTILVEEYIEGREATCGVLDNFRKEDYYALPPIEILPPENSKFFDYEVKYNGSTREICPANFDLATKRQIENIAKRAHKALGCVGYSRSDMIISPKGIYLLELNTLPGLTSESLFPKSANAIGLSFSSLLEHLINLALNK